MGIYKVEGSPYWQYDFTVQGKRHRGSTEATKRGEAEAIYAKRRSEALLGNFYDQEGQISLSDAFDRYEEERAQFTASYDSTQSHIDYIVAYFGEGKMLHQISQADLATLVTHCRQEKSERTKRLISNATINRRLATFQGMHNDARLVWGIEVQNIDFRKLKLKEPPPVDNTLSRQDFDKWMAKAPLHLKHYLMFSVYAGLRKMNILNLQGEQIDMERKIIRAIGKGGKPLNVPIVDALAEYIEAHGLHLKKHVITRNGSPIRDIKTSWRTLCRDMKRKIRPHDMRHTCGTWIYEATGDLLAIKEHLHHSDLKTSMRYTHTKKDSQLEKLNKALNPKLRIVK
jgi:integrase